jgi:hypothetical protein
MILPMGHAEILKRDLHLIIDDNDYTKLLYRASQYPFMKSLLERLAPEECPTHLVPEYYDMSSLGCKYCDCTTMTKHEWDHETDCPWVEARKLLEELK